MADGQKTPIAQSLTRVAVKRINDAMQQFGRALPCSVVAIDGAIVTVKFEVNTHFTLPKITIPLFGPEYIRYPIQVGDKGFTVPADVFLGSISDLGIGTADLSTPGNLSALVFFPIGSKNWDAVDPNSVTIYGPNGVVLRDTGSNSTIVLTPSSIILTGQDSVTIVSGGASMEVFNTGNFAILGSGIGLIAGNTLTIQDALHYTTTTIMHDAWAALVIWLNTHTHASSGSGVPNTPFTGGSIAP